MFRMKVFKLLFTMIVILVFASTAYALAASNTFTGNNSAGDGTEVISGFAVSNIDYTLNYANPSTISSVSFDINPVPTEARISLDGGTTWYDCTEAANTSCTVGGEAVSTAANLTVVAK
jgi:hypothetical protein